MSHNSTDSVDNNVFVRRAKQRELAELLDDVERFFRRFVVFPSDPADRLDGVSQEMTVGEAQAIVTALWIAHAHALDAFHATPRLVFTSAEPESGKTTALEVAASLVPDPVLTGNVTAAALYRGIEAGMMRVILVDEFDALYSGIKSERNEDLRVIVNTGYRRGSNAIRCVGRMQTPERFKTFAPVALAGIDNGHMPDTIASRCIFIRLKAKLSREHVEPFIPSDYEHEAAQLRDRLTAWADGPAGSDALRGVKATGLERLNNRRQEIARPLQAIAQAAGPEWAERSRAALQILLAKRKTGSITVRLLRDLHRVFDNAKSDRLFTSEILSALNSDETAPWPRWKKGREAPALNAIELASLLRPHNIKPKTIWKGEVSNKGYERADFIDPWQRHVMPFIAASPERPSRPSGTSDRNGHRPDPAEQADAVARIAALPPRRDFPFRPEGR